MVPDEGAIRGIGADLMGRLRLGAVLSLNQVLSQSRLIGTPLRDLSCKET